MIYLAFKGQLGNQLFQYATYKELKKEFKVLPDFQWFYERNKTPEILKILPDIEFHKNDISKIADVKKTMFSRIKKHCFRKKTHYIENQLQFNDLKKVLRIKEYKDIYIDGYWQSYKYFENSLDEIKDELLPSMDYENIRSHLHKNVGEFRLCSLHIRRGDYRNDKNMELLDIEYFKKHIINYLNDYPRNKVIIFSDDIKFCKENFSDMESVLFCDWNATALNDLYSMACCEDHILSNSSFSYWGALLGRNENPKVYYPFSWFKFAKNADLSFMFPSYWICVR